MPVALAPLLPAIIGAGGAVGSAVIGAHAAGSASSDYGQQIDKAIEGMNAAEGRVGNLYDPYVGMGKMGIQGLENSGLFGAPTYDTNGSLASNSLGEQWNTPFTAPTAQQVADTPGYQFAKEEGMNGIQQSAASQGNLLTGGTMKGLESYGTGLANQYYQQAYNNALDQYMNNYNIFNQNQANQYNRLMGATGLGLNATNSLASANMSGAESIANLLAGKGTATANAALAGGNAWSNGLSGATQAIQLGMMNQNKSGYGGSPATLPVNTLNTRDYGSLYPTV